MLNENENPADPILIFGSRETNKKQSSVENQESPTSNKNITLSSRDFLEFPVAISRIFTPICFLSFFSYDARSGSGEVGRRWSDDKGGFGGRAYFQVKTLPAVLVVDEVTHSEAGIYRCRVDFKTAPTRNSLVNLTVIGEFSKKYNFASKMGNNITRGFRSETKCLSPICSDGRLASAG